jgi:hypothetical protein
MPISEPSFTCSHNCNPNKIKPNIAEEMRYWKFRPHLFFLTAKTYCFESFNYTASKTYIKNTFSGIV